MSPSSSPSEALSGRLALVTGASAGIGAATARALARAGARVVLAARREERLAALAAELPGAEPLVLDVRDADAVRASLEARPFYLVVNNAGLARGAEAVHLGAYADHEEVVETNVTGVLHVLRATLPGMIARGGGDQVFLGSVAGREVYPGGTVYCATKHAVKAIYTGARRDSVGSGVRFSTVDPGMVRTDFSGVRFRGDEERVEAVYQGVEPLQPEDVADAILYAVTRPPHVNIGEIVMWSAAQASTWSCARRE